MAMRKGAEAKVNVLCMVDHIVSEGDRLFVDTLYAGMWVVVMDGLSAFWEGATQEYLKEQGFGKRVLGLRGTTNTVTCWATRRCGNATELMPLNSNLFSDWEHGMEINCAISSILVPVDVVFELKFNICNITELKSAAAQTWARYPTPKRIVEDIIHFPAALAAVIAAKGAVVSHVKRRGRQKRAKHY